MIRADAETLLQIAINDSNARFRDGQWEAIDALVNHRQKLMLVQRTGWGKSSVYFISTRIMRDHGAGPTVIVSPLLALMRNQIEAANRLGIRAESVNSTNQGSWPTIRQSVLADEVDAILISPERLSNEEFVETVLLPVANRIGLLVVDEVHCISDWGHDFRPDYRRLTNVLRQMPPNMPILGTTATANNRVIQDVRKHLGDIDILRGTLGRDSLVLQTLRLVNQADRLAWLAQHIPKLPDTGIVYVLTIRDAEQVANWLNQQGIMARAYYSNVDHEAFNCSNLYRQHLENLLLSNEIKVLVATTALGMGYDKPDLGFVIHYQAPSSVVSYYQQVGRAGRSIDKAFGVLLAGKEDEDIHEFFRRSAFPEEQDVIEILNILEDHEELSVVQLQQHLNLTPRQIDKVLKILSVENPAPVIKHGNKWRRTPVPFRMDYERIEHLTQQRELEWQEVQDYIDSDGCLMAYLQNALDDPKPKECYQCSVCTREPVVGIDVGRDLAITANQFLKNAEIPFKPKNQVASGAFQKYSFLSNLPIALRASEGRILCRWGDSGWGSLVKYDKYADHFRDELVEALVEMIKQRWLPDPAPQWITCVPSSRHPVLVLNFAQRLANQLKLPFVNVFRKVINNEPQKKQQNRFHQCRNLDGVFELSESIPKTAVLLVDDVIDSGWTVTVLAALLRRAGSGAVYPVALASTRA